MSANAIERLSRYVGESWDETMGHHWHDWNEARRALATVEALLEAVNETLGYGADLNPVWQLGAGQDWTEWTEAKDRLRAARRQVETGQ